MLLPDSVMTDENVRKLITGEVKRGGYVLNSDVIPDLIAQGRHDRAFLLLSTMTTSILETISQGENAEAADQPKRRFAGELFDDRFREAAKFLARALLEKGDEQLLDQLRKTMAIIPPNFHSRT